MKLRDLDARLKVCVPSAQHGGTVLRDVGTVAEAHAVIFLCPKCFADNLVRHGDGKYGTHSVLVYFVERPVDPTLKPLPRWRASGTSVDDLTLEPSVHLNPSAPPPEPGQPDVCRWHGFVRGGDAS